jgi:hypothetical protein
MDLLAVERLNWGKRGHFARDCKSPPKSNSKRISFSKSNVSKCKRTLYETVEDLSDDNQSDYGVLNTSDSELEDHDTLNVLNIMSTYEFNNHDQASVTSNNRLVSKKLPVYDLVINEESG